MWHFQHFFTLKSSFSPADGTTTSTYASSLPDPYPLNFVFWVRKACNVYELSTLRLLVVVHIFEKINPVDLGNIPMSHRKIIRVSDARQYPFQFLTERLRLAVFRLVRHASVSGFLNQAINVSR